MLEFDQGLGVQGLGLGAESLEFGAGGVLSYREMRPLKIPLVAYLQLTTLSSLEA